MVRLKSGLDEDQGQGWQQVRELLNGPADWAERKLGCSYCDAVDAKKLRSLNIDHAICRAAARIWVCSWDGRSAPGTRILAVGRT